MGAMQVKGDHAARSLQAMALKRVRKVAALQKQGHRAGGGGDTCSGAQRACGETLSPCVDTLAPSLSLG